MSYIWHSFNPTILLNLYKALKVSIFFENNNEFTGLHKIYLEVDLVDFYTIRAYEDFIIKHISLNNRIPGRVLTKFFSLFRNRMNVKYDDNKKHQEGIKILIDKIISDALINYSKDPEYYFEEKNKKNSFTQLMQELSVYLTENIVYLWNDTEVSKRKDVLVKLVYDNINRYFTLCNAATNKFYGKYKRSVLVGYILWKFGFHLSQKLTSKQLLGKHPTNQQFYESIKYHLNKIRKVYDA